HTTWGNSYVNIQDSNGRNIEPNLSGGNAPRALDTWHCVEHRLTTNDPATVSNGYMQTWVNGKQTMEYPNIVGLVRTGSGGRWYQVTMSGYWNCVNTDCSQAVNAHPNMTRWVDNLVVSTQRIGCLGTPPPAPPPPPSAPSQLKVN
ncbi:MAG: hypothetical protein ACREMB_01650, partial [Candidatus Rokuibacteriota bacterium]